MEKNATRVSVEKVKCMPPKTCVCDRALIVTGKIIKIAAVHDEIWLEGEAVDNPDQFISGLKRENFKADVFTFGQKFPETKRKYAYHCEWDNFAVVPITTYAEWWEKRLPQESRRNVRIAGKRGVVVDVAEFNDDLVRGIAGIYNETPIRQGRPFCHYGKDVETVRMENGTYLERSQFLGAYHENELIGFIKLVYVNEIASIMQFLSKNEHLDKKPMNALLARAVELSEKRGSRYLVYRKFTYGSVYSALTEFKRRNGFEKMQYPRYYVPLTWKGELGLKLRLHQGLRDSLPPGLIARLTNLRSKYIGLFGPKRTVAVSQR
ncbi:MAG TPA: hypothetical protein VIT21_10815 [Chthoniobacterales bacterium]